MPESEHDQFLPSFRAWVKGGGWRGLAIDTPAHWVVSGVRNPILFFRSLAKILPPGSVLYMEGEDIRPWAIDLYQRHVPNATVPVKRDTIVPEPKVFHVVFSDVLIDELCESANGRDTGEFFYHIKGYCTQKMIFEFHDAFRGQLFIRVDVAEQVVADFCTGLGASYAQQVRPTREEGMEKMRRILRGLENYGRAPLPFWKRVAIFLFGSKPPE